MIGLRGTRVFILDDEKDDVLPLVQTLSKNGIAASYYDERLNSLPLKENRLVGVRLAILDMDILGGGTSPKEKAAAVSKRISRILSKRNGPYGIIAWTNHPELVQLFEEYLFADAESPRPSFVVKLTKAECKTRSGKYDLGVLSTKLMEKLRECSPLLILQAWEEQSFVASSEVSNILSSLTSPDGANLNEWRTSWKKEILGIMHALSHSLAGKNTEALACLESFYSSLNPLHADRVERLSYELAKSLEANAGDILAIPRTRNEDAIAKINTMLHLASDSLDQYRGGNIYFFTGARKPGWIPRKESLIDDLMKIIQNNPAQQETNKQMVIANSVLVLIEASAPCDHAQKNIRVGRFIMGLAVRKSDKDKLKNDAGFSWQIGPLFMNNGAALQGEYEFYFSARHMITVDLRRAKKLKAKARLRTQAFTDLQAWFSRHASRPGMMLLNK